jgi:hypothetical protein
MWQGYPRSSEAPLLFGLGRPPCFNFLRPPPMWQGSPRSSEAPLFGPGRCHHALVLAPPPMWQGWRHPLEGQGSRLSVPTQASGAILVCGRAIFSSPARLVNPLFSPLPFLCSSAISLTRGARGGAFGLRRRASCMLRIDSAISTRAILWGRKVCRAAVRAVCLRSTVAPSDDMWANVPTSAGKDGRPVGGAFDGKRGACRCTLVRYILSWPGPACSIRIVLEYY